MNIDPPRPSTYRALFYAYQPVVVAPYGVEYFEMLVRPRRFDDRPISTNLFVPEMENGPHSFDFDSYTLRSAITVASGLPNNNFGFNISGLTAMNPQAIEMLASMKIKPSVAERLVVEITETIPLTDREQAIRFIEAFQEMGGRVAIDDFGAEGRDAQLTRELVTAMAPNIIKIDRDRQIGLLTDPGKQKYIWGVLEFAEKINARLVIEGVSDEATADSIQEHCPTALQQGYYWGVPMQVPTIWAVPIKPPRPSL